MYLLDTNVAVAALNRNNAGLWHRLASELSSGSTVLLSTIVLFELRFGVANSAMSSRNKVALDEFMTAPFVIAPLEDEDADHAGDVRAFLKRAGTPIGPYEVLIAAQARRRRATLVTANRREFERVPGLVVEDWGSAGRPGRNRDEP